MFEFVLPFSVCQFSSSVDGPDEEGNLELHDEATSDGHSTSAKANGDAKVVPRHMPTWLQHSTPDEFLVRELLIHS